MAAGDNTPLAGITVIEHAEGVAASYAGRLLAVMGATVIKVEPPGGCTLRTVGPLLTNEPPATALFHYVSANKQFITCNLASAEGNKQFSKLLETADVLLDDTPLTDRAARKLDAEHIARAYPKLVHVSVLPFGASGPHAGYRAHEINVFHAGGEGYLMPNGLTLEMFPERAPVKIYGHFAEFMGGTSAVCATLAALLKQPDVGGQYVDISVQDANLAVGCFAIQRLGDGELENRFARSFKYGGVLECRDGYVQVLTLEPRQWAGLVELLGKPAWALEPAMNDALERGRRGADINRHLRAWAKTQSVDDAVNRGQALGVPIAKYQSPADIFASAQSQAREMFASVELPGVGQAQMPTAPFQFPQQPLRITRAAAAPGADNTKIKIQ